MEVMHGGGGISLSVIRPCKMDVTSSMALDMYRSLHLTIPYLQRGEREDLEDKFQSWIGNIRLVENMIFCNSVQNDKKCPL